MTLLMQTASRILQAAPSRLIAKVEGSLHGPTVVFIGGMHGNEPAGVLALETLMPFIEENRANLKGKVFAIRGNISALACNSRFVDQDLNRIWTTTLLAGIQNKMTLDAEEKEAKEMLELIQEILQDNRDKVCFIDLHTTSAPSIPFITLNDMLINRDFASPFPVPKILGLEEFLKGPLLSYINEMGHVAIGFEAGQHQDPMAVSNCVSFINLCLIQSGCFPVATFDVGDELESLAEAAKGEKGFFEVVYRHEIRPLEQFGMLQGFTNFMPIERHQKLAMHEGQPVFSTYEGRIFMPLYQAKGSDGFFIIQDIPQIALYLSKWLRKINFIKLITFFPGVRWGNKATGTLVVNEAIARYFTKSFFHLLGFTIISQAAGKLLLKQRDKIEI
jgi:hypothetical protein